MKDRTLKILQTFTERDSRNLNASGLTISCGKGCNACCSQWIGAQYLEAKACVDYASKAGLDIDLSEVTRQSEAALAGGVTRINWFNRYKCIFSTESGACGVYPCRPLACRSHHVVSDPRGCGDAKGTVRRVDNRTLAHQAGAAIQAEHMMQALTPVVAALPVMVKLVLEGKGPAELGQTVGLVGLDGEISDEEVDERIANADR